MMQLGKHVSIADKDLVKQQEIIRLKTKAKV